MACLALTLPEIIARLSAELAEVVNQLQALPSADWLSTNGRHLANREQELYTALQVLRGMRGVHAIEEPALSSHQKQERNPQPVS